MAAAAAVIARCSALPGSAGLFGLTMLMAMRGRSVPRGCGDGRSKASDAASHRSAGRRTRIELPAAIIGNEEIIAIS